MTHAALTATIADPASVAALAGAIRAWEPRIDLDFRGREGLLYDPEATLYALNLGEPCVLSTDRRRQSLDRAGRVAVPAGMGVEVDPSCAFLLFRAYGPPPPHFRERFVQVQGFEVLASGTKGHRFRFETFQSDGQVAGEIAGDAWEARLVIGVGGESQVEGVAGAGAGVRTVGVGAMVLAWPGTPIRLRGPGEVVVVAFAPEEVHRERLHAGAAGH